MKKIKNLAILTSGGDCAGLNAAIRSVIIKASSLGWNVFGIIEGTKGLLERPVNHIKLNKNMADINLLNTGGTILKSINKGNPLSYPMGDGTYKNRTSEVLEGLKSLNIDALIAIGGDGSMAILSKITEKINMPFIGIPKTIDNDVPFTDFSIGFSTALDVVTENLKNLYTTTLSHNRVMIAELMGRDAGHLALQSGISSGADIILIPEMPYNMENLTKKVQEIYKKQSHVLIASSEAAIDTNKKQIYKNTPSGKKFGGVSEYLANQIAKKTSLPTSSSILGLIQRGGKPNSFDKLLATSFGIKAIELLNEGHTKKIVVMQNNTISAVDLKSIVGSFGGVEKSNYLLNVAKNLNIYLGE